MIDLETALGTRLLLVDDDIEQLELRALLLKMSGFTVLTASGPVEAIAIISQGTGDAVDVAILDYHMPVINGCILAGHVRRLCPDLKIILHSAAADIPESEMRSVDAIVPKTAGLTSLLAQISEFSEGRATSVTPSAPDLGRSAGPSY
jgi:CheY-like chemotaxis protein